MLIENIYKQIAEIEREIAILPEGSITKKKIKDKDYYYHRITRSGKRIENYVSFEQVPDLKEKIEKRKALEKKLRELKRMLQGDSGHAQAKMVTDQYSHILDEDRKNNAQIFEDVFYQKKTPGQIAAEQAGQSAGIDPELLMKVLTNPEMAKLLKALAGTIE